MLCACDALEHQCHARRDPKISPADLRCYCLQEDPSVLDKAKAAASDVADIAAAK